VTAALASGNDAAFSYETAFARNLGWVTPAEQQALRGKRVAIAGLGGVGGVHLLTLARLGIGRFHLADFDRFELSNFNRQSGATVSTLGAPKVEVLARMARDINPDLEIELFPEGVTRANLDAFLAGVDVYVDGLDFFAFEAREVTFAACHAARIPATTVAPLGMGAALLNFVPGGMSFEEYFQLAGADENEKLVRFLVGLSPAMLQRRYLVDRRYVDFLQHRGPSTAMACQLCAGIAATEVLKMLLRRGRIHAAPMAVQFDAYRSRLAHTWRPGGNRNPLQRVAIAIARRQLARMGSRARAKP
jgi:molybdopterin/thiamine biosynthesis adenylyltransferase